MVSEHGRRRRVEFADTDAAGIIHFASYFRYMEETEHEFLRSLGLSVDLVHDGRRFGFPRIAARCEFVRPLRFEDEVDILLLVTHVGRSSLTYQFLMTRGGEEVARGEIATACCLIDRDGRLAAVPIPPILRQRIQVSPAAPLELGRRAKSAASGVPDDCGGL